MWRKLDEQGKQQWLNESKALKDKVLNAQLEQQQRIYQAAIKLVQKKQGERANKDDASTR